MLDTECWVILDTETTGLRTPIYPVEIAAQRMQGWRPVGLPFRVLLNFDVPIEPGAERIHGYSRDFLRMQGKSPAEAIDAFLRYADNQPVVAYNLPYDFDRVLAPTLRRMNLRARICPGFCALELARKLLPSLPDHKLMTVIKRFNVARKQEHRAKEDVDLVVRLFADLFMPHLVQHGVEGFQRVAACASGAVRVPPITAPPVRATL